MSDRIIKLPYRGATQTVSVMREAALLSQDNLSVRNLAEKICQNLRGKDYLSEILAINNYVESHCRYMRDPRITELVKSPYLVAEALMRGETPQLDCDDLCSLIIALLLSVGCECRITVVAFSNQFHNGERQYSHTFAEALEPKSNTWIVCDPVAGRKTPQMLARGVAFKFFSVT